MTDDELIASLENYTSEVFSRPEIDRLIALARQVQEARNAVTGWAILDNGQIIVSTVSPHRRAAIINWLVTERAMMVFNTDSDEKIEASWQSMKMTAECCVVAIRALQVKP